MNLNTLKDKVLPEVIQAVESTVIPRTPNGNNPLPDKERKIIDSALEIVNNQILDYNLHGAEPNAIKSKYKLRRETIKKLLENTDPSQTALYKRESSLTKLALSNLLDEVITDRVENQPQAIKFSELAIASGIMAQRSIELGKEGDVGALPDFSKLGEWDKPKDPPSDGQVMTNVIDV